ncbi:MAG: HAMP domain-containing histidine kinase [Gudongella sp.]|nr:HAMP domain-containing histidine kinase [Gudongella sp.]
MKIFKKLYWDLIIKYIIFLVTSIVMTGLFIGILLTFVMSSMSEHPEVVRDMNLYFNNIQYDGREGELKLPADIEENAWVEIVKDNKVVHVEGTKLDDKQEYTQEDFALIANNLDELTETEDYTYEYLPFTGEDGEDYILLYKKVKEGSGIFKVGFGLPENVQGTDFERDLSIKVGYSLAVFITIIILILLLFGRVTSRKIMSPLNEMNKGFKKIMKGDYSTRLDFKGNIEFEEIRDAFNYMTERLEKAELENKSISESKKRLLLDISHDLRTPTTTIQGYAEALQSGMVEKEEDQKKYLSYIHEKSKVVTNLVDTLFKYTKLDSSVYDLNKKEADLAEFLRNVVISFYGELEDKSFSLDINIPEEEVLFSFDEIELERALDNIIGNIIKYNREGTTLSVSLSENGEGIELVIEDNGIGISEEIKESIFNALVRGDNARKSDGGTGLGLAISKKIIELHGGSISLDSEEGKGSRFIISFGSLK